MASANPTALPANATSVMLGSVARGDRRAHSRTVYGSASVSSRFLASLLERSA